MNLSNLFLSLFVIISSLLQDVFSDEKKVIPDHFYYENRSKIELTNGTVNYQLHEESKEGPIAICLHCFMDTLSGCSSISKNLSKNGFRALRFDFYGHGLSKYKTFGYYTLDDYVDQTVEMLEKLGLYNLTHVDKYELSKKNFVPKLYLVGTSLGALVAMRIAQRYPKHINKVVLDAPPGLLKKNLAPYLQYSVLNYFLQLMANIYSPKWFCYQFLDPPTENLSSPKLDFRANYYCKQILLTSLQLFLGINLWNNVNLYKEFSNVDVDTLFFWGSEDKLCPLSSAIGILNEYVPNSKIIVYENCKHRCSRYCKEKFIKDTVKYFKGEFGNELVSITEYYNSMSDKEKLSEKKSLPGIRGSSALEPPSEIESICSKGSNTPEVLIKLGTESIETSASDSSYEKECEN